MRSHVPHDRARRRCRLRPVDDEEPTDGDRTAATMINGRKWLITGALGATVADHHGPHDRRRRHRPRGHDVPDRRRHTRHRQRRGPRHHGLEHRRRPLGDRPQRRAPAPQRRARGGRSLVSATRRFASVPPGSPTACAGWAPRAALTTSPPTTPAPARRSARPLGEHEGIGFQLADNLIEMQLCRLAIWHCAWVLDQGEPWPATSRRWPSCTARRRSAGSSTGPRADPRRHGHHQPHRRPPDLRGHPGLPHLRRPQRGAPHGDRPQGDAGVATSRRGAHRETATLRP